MCILEEGGVYVWTHTVPLCFMYGYTTLRGKNFFRANPPESNGGARKTRTHKRSSTPGPSPLPTADREKEGEDTQAPPEQKGHQAKPQGNKKT